MAGWSLRDWKRLKALHAQHSELQHAMDVASIRYSAEGCKDLAMNIVTGVVAGLVVARFSEWKPTPAAWEVVIIVLGFSMVAFGIGRQLATLAAKCEVAADKGRDLDPVIRMAKAVGWVPVALLALGAGFAVYKLLTIPAA